MSARPLLLGFLRIATNTRSFERPDSIGHPASFGRQLAHGANGANLLPDAHLAALAIEHGLALCSTAGDFARFPGLRWVNPCWVNPLTSLPPMTPD